MNPRGSSGWPGRTPDRRLSRLGGHGRDALCRAWHRSSWSRSALSRPTRPAPAGSSRSTRPFDGIEKLGDQYLISDFNGTIYRVNSDGTSESVADFTEAEFGLGSTADIGLDPATGTVMIPDLVGNEVYWFTLP